MSILPDAGRMASASPPCPAWCMLPPGHDLPVVPVPVTEVLHREHAAVVLDDPAVGVVELVQLDEVLGGDGPAAVAAFGVQVTAVGGALQPVQVHQLVRALAAAAALAQDHLHTLGVTR